MRLDFREITCVSCSAIDASGTEIAYAEQVKRGGITGNDIADAVLTAMERLSEGKEGFQVGDVMQVIVRFSEDT